MSHGCRARIPIVVNGYGVIGKRVAGAAKT
jgi:glyceraldehyde-3-phosphate dehydrogenase/erythrose-4-phosphate dehydrogenase